MDVDRLFLHELAELDRRVRTNDEYATLMIAANLRKLLLDARPLALAVNETRRLRLTFLVNDQREDPASLRARIVEAGLFLWARQDGFDPFTAKPGSLPPSELRLGELLNVILLMWRGYEATVHEVIDYVAHVEGAVHAGAARSAKDIALREMAQQVAVGGSTPVVRSLMAVGRVVLRGLAPLRDRVIADLEKRGETSPVQPTRVPNASADSVIARLEGMGYHHKTPGKQTAAGGEIVRPVELYRWEDDVLESIVVVCEGDGIRLLTIGALPIGKVEPKLLDTRVGERFAEIAGIEVLTSDPVRAASWARANVAQPGASLTLGTVLLEVDPHLTMPGEDYRLTIAAIGARAVE